MGWERGGIPSICQIVQLLIEFFEPVGDLLHAVRIGARLQQDTEQQQRDHGELELD
jgi:hypothetical protein